MKEKNKLKIAVATHKKFQMPTQAGYFPLHVGKSRHTQKLSEYVGDDTGDNISDKNPFFCELTGLYWLWKNTDSEYVGMVHYRRYFRSLKKCHGRNRMNYILQEPEVIRLLQKHDIILPFLDRNSLICRTRSDFSRCPRCRVRHVQLCTLMLLVLP